MQIKYSYTKTFDKEQVAFPNFTKVKSDGGNFDFLQVNTC